MVIAHNMQAMNASRQYSVVTGRKAKSTEKLASGYRINRAADDAAGLTISEKMRSQIRGLNQGTDNIQDGISVCQIADGALAEVNDMLHRMTELSVKSANGTNTDEDRAAIQREVHELVCEIDRISQSTEFNTMPLFDDMFGENPEGSVTTLVTSPAADTGYLTESYYDGNYYRPSASLDFSGITASNIKKLDGQGFSFNCSESCDEVFDIKFAAKGQPSSATNLTGAVTHKYVVDISSCKNGTDVVNAIYNFVASNPPTGRTAPLVSHSNSIATDGNKIIVYSSSSSSHKYSSPAAAENAYKNGTGRSGKILCSELTNIVEEDKINNIKIQCSSTKDDSLDFDIPWMNAGILGIKGINVDTRTGALAAIDTVKNATAKVSSMRSGIGAAQNRLEHAYANNQNKAENTQAAESRIRDTDMAKEMVALSLSNILAQAGESMMAQANQSTQGVLSLLS